MGLGLGTMRRVVIEMGALLALSGLLGCAGGQTGEITEPSECDAIAETLVDTTPGGGPRESRSRTRK